MDDHPQREGFPLILRRIPASATPGVELPEGFFPLRLYMQPGCVGVELIQPEILLGRHSCCDIRLPVPDVSRRHCRFQFSEGEWVVLDLNSLNGTFVNGEKLRQGVLRDGDQLQFGEVTLRVDLSSAGRPGVEPEARSEETPGILQKIADVFPRPRQDMTEEYRKAS